MTTQLELLETTPEWQLDEATREAGRRGVQQARSALAEAQRKAYEDRQPQSAERRRHAA